MFTPSRNRLLRLPAFVQIVKPLWEPFVMLFPELAPLLGNLNINIDCYFQEGQRLEQQRLSAVELDTTSRTDNGKDRATGGGGGDKEGFLADAEVLGGRPARCDDRGGQNASRSRSRSPHRS